MEIDTNVKREEVEKLINELMVGEKGKKMRQKSIELKKMAEKNTSPGGFSYMNLDKVHYKFITSLSTFYTPFAIPAAEEHKLPAIIFNPFSACNFLTSLHFRTLLEKGLIPLKGNNL
jgi:hypothetical protein